jgi:hypothetical protein
MILTMDARIAYDRRHACSSRAPSRCRYVSTVELKVRNLTPPSGAVMAVEHLSDRVSTYPALKRMLACSMLGALEVDALLAKHVLKVLQLGAIEIVFVVGVLNLEAAAERFLEPT